MILVTGGTGYIGSHTVVDLVQNGHEVVVFDNLSNSSITVLEGIRGITGRSIDFVRGDVRDASALVRLFRDYPISAVVHFAGHKSVEESVANPLMYYDNNVIGSIRLLQTMALAKIHTLVFSSSATVYGNPDSVPLSETSSLNPNNPYGRSKLFVENVLQDFANTSSEWRIAVLRYFNPVGAHESGKIGENPNGQPSNVMPRIGQVAAGKLSCLNIFGNDYETPDGTGMRDYIHVVDLARGHRAALNVMRERTGLMTLNLGTGRAYSVLDLVQTFQRASQRTIPYVFMPRRTGDVATSYANPALAKAMLGWEAKFDLFTMCADAWRWHKVSGNL